MYSDSEIADEIVKHIGYDAPYPLSFPCASVSYVPKRKVIQMYIERGSTYKAFAIGERFVSDIRNFVCKRLNLSESLISVEVIAVSGAFESRYMRILE